MSADDHHWRFQCHPGRVVDGDTYDLLFDLGFHINRSTRVRLAGVDTAEIYGVPKDSDEYAAGSEHKEYVSDWFTEAVNAGPPWPLVVTTEKATGKYGRYVAQINRRCDGADLATDLVSAFPEVADE